MNEGVLKEVKYKLKLEHYLMNDEWLKDCVDFYIDQHGNPGIEEIFQFVKVQWQLGDLREINNENGSLPSNLSQQKFMTLQENYILQVEQMYDISTSKYKQLEQIRKTQVSEVDLSEADKLEKSEQPKKRMIQLRLTDGLQDVVGIEYSHIERLNDKLLPGYKVLIMGPVQCHKGVLLLEQKNFKGIGGEADSLLISNALENILARALNLQENPDPYNDNQTKASVNKQEEAEIHEHLFEEDFDINLEEVSKIENSHSTTNKSNKDINNVTNNEIQQIEKCKKNQIMDDDDSLFEMIDEGQFIDPWVQEKRIATPYRVLPKQENDEIIVINDEDKLISTKYHNEKQNLGDETYSEHSSSTLFVNKTEPRASVSHSKIEQKQLLVTGEKRNIQMSPDRIPPKRGKIDRKITELTKKTKSLEPQKICEFIRTINNEKIIETTFRTIRGHVDILGKLAKKDSLWTLNATVGDGTGTIEVSFSNKVLEELLGFTVEEFSLKKKLKKNPEVEHELRMSFRIAEQKVKTMDALLELQLKFNETPTVIKITDLTQEQKQSIDIQLKQFLIQNNI